MRFFEITLRTFIFSIILLIARSLFTQSVYAQDYSLRLKSGEFTPPENQKVSEVLLAGNTFQKPQVFLLQFFNIPSTQQLAVLKDAGITLMDYLPEKAFFAALTGPADANVLEHAGVRSIVKIQPNYKMQPSLLESSLPEWAINRPGKIDLIVSYFQVFDHHKVKSELMDQGWEILEESEPFGHFVMRVPISKLNEVALLPEVYSVEPIMPPAVPENYTARQLHRSNAIANNFTGGRKYNGEGVVVAMGDDGIIGPHIDYTGRIDNSRVSNNSGNHGDHVAGTICGAGNLDPTTRGMAPGATLLVYNVWNAVNESENDHQDFDVMITSTSYSNGCNAGYTGFARTADQIVRQNPSLIHIFSSGNDGTSNCDYGAGAGWGNVTGGVKIGKNVVAVGNLNENGILNNSSSVGPAEDGRIKPEICAKGTNVISTIDVNTYDNFTGTSMSCPGVSGTFAQLYHAYRELNGGADPESGLIKAIVMNTADDVMAPGLDFRTGFGEINAFQAVKVLEENDFLTDSVDNGAQKTHILNIPSGTKKARIMLYWTDWEGSVLTSKALVNDLDLTVTDPASNEYLPWVLNDFPHADSLSLPAKRGIDNLNNVEQFSLENPQPGDSIVKVNGSTVPQGPQKYFIVYTLENAGIDVTYPIGGESLVPGEQEIIRWDAATDTATFMVEASKDNGITWNTLASSVPANMRQLNWTVPNAVTGNALIRVTRGSNSGTSLAPFSIIRVPGNFRIESACPEYIILAWDSVAGAEEYEISMLGTQYMDSIGTTSQTQFTVIPFDQFSENWFSVKALGNDAVGRRAIAIYKEAGIWNCPEPGDIAVDEVLVPAEGINFDCAIPGPFQVKVRLRNYSPDTITGIPVKYQLDNGVVVVDSFTGTLAPYSTENFTFNEVLAIGSIPGSYQLDAWVDFLTDVNPVNDTFSMAFEIFGGDLVEAPFTENFEDFTLCSVSSNCQGGQCTMIHGWLNVQNNTWDEIDWRTNIGNTPTSETGPSEDHDPGTIFGKYLYLEATSCNLREARLISPCIDFSNVTDAGMNYWFYFAGEDMGEMHLDIYYDGEWIEDISNPKDGGWAPKWWQETVDLNDYSGKPVNLRWRGITGRGSLSDMAIDDINFFDGTVATSNPLSQESQLVVYPIPNEGSFFLENRSDENRAIVVEIYDVNGRMVFLQPKTELHSHSRIPVKIEAPSGLYYLKARGKTISTTLKLMIRK